MVWEDRPALSCEPAWLLDIRYSGQSAGDKLSFLRSVMEENHADVHILTSLDDIAWLFNIRGGDIPNNPVVLSYAVITLTDAILFIQSGAVTDEVREGLAACGVSLMEYHSVYDYVKTLPASSTVLCDKKRVNYTLIHSLPEGISLVDLPNPTTARKAVKNETELNNLRMAHVKDGVAVVDREKCVACGRCVAECPNHLIELVPYRAPYRVACGSHAKGKAVRQACDAGCIGCGICVKQCEAGAITLTDQLAKIDYAKCTGCGKCAEKCPSKIIRKIL